LAFIFILLLIVFFFIINADLKKSHTTSLQISYQASLIDTISDAIFTTDNNLIIKSWNKSASNLYGYTAIEAIGQQLPTLLKVNIGEEERQKSFISLKKDGYYKQEYQIIKKNGQSIFVLASISTIVNKGVINGYVSVHRDITERKQLEDQLKEFNNQLEKQVKVKTVELTGIFERITDGFIALDTNWCFTYVNERVCKMLEESPESFIGKNIWTDFPESQNNELFYDSYHKAMETQQYFFDELYYPSLKIWIENYVYPSPSGLSVYFRDVTDKKKIEGQIQKAKEFSDKIIDSLPGVFYLIESGATKLIRWNERLQLVTGYTMQEIAEKDFIEFINPADRQMIMQKIETAFLIGQENIEANLLTKFGKTIPFYFTAMAVEIEGKPFLIGNGIDISARINAEEKLQKSFRQIQLLASLSEALSQAEHPKDIYELGLNAFINIINAEKTAICLFNEKDKMCLVASKNMGALFIKQFQDFCDWENEVQFTRSIFILDVNKVASLEKIQPSCNVEEIVSMGFIPLIYQNTVLGKFVITFKAHHIFSEEEKQLIETIARDVAFAISEKNVQLALKSSSQKYKHLFDYNPMPMWMISYPERNFIDVNKAALKHYGYTREDFLQMNVLDIRPPKDVDLFKKMVNGLNPGSDYNGIWRHRKKNGDIIRVQIIAHEIVYEGNNVRLILAIDIDAKIKAEEKLQQSYQQIRQLAMHLQNIREEERTNIAREIHDELGQQLTGLKMYISWLTKKIKTQDPEIQTKFTNTMELIEDTIKSVRKISTELRPSMLDDLGLLAAMEWQSNEFEKRSGIPIELINLTNNEPIPHKYTTGLFRIFQESLTNVARHADAKKVTSSLLYKDSELTLNIQDDGKGFILHNIGSKKTLGLFGMKERAMEMGGSYEIISEPGFGTTVSIKIPIN
jgi:PAS domain S-box-containing protein